TARDSLPRPDLMLLEELSKPPRPAPALEPAPEPGAAGLPAVPDVAYRGIRELSQPGRSHVEREVRMTAHESSERADDATRRDIGDTTLEQVHADVTRLS